MRKLAILATALVPLLGGCVSSAVSSTCDLPTATFSWQLRDTSGTPWTCSQAGVYYVDIYFDGTSFSHRAYCADGGVVLDVSGLAPGSYPVTVEGVAADGTIYDRANSFNVVVGSCGGGQYYPVLGEATLNVDYHFSPTDVCHGGYMWYALYDNVAGQWISVVDQGTPVGGPPDYTVWQTAFPCGPTLLAFPVPFGTYTLAWIQEVTNPTTAPAAVQQACVQPAFHVTGPGTANLTVTLTDNTVSPAICPAYP